MSVSEKRTVQDIHFRLTAGGHSYMVEAQGPMGEARATFALPFSELETENFVLRMNVLRRSFGRSGRAPEPAQPTVEFGGRLYAALCSGEVREALAAERRAAELNGYGLRLKLHLSAAPALADLPWEFLHDGRGFLALSTQTPLVRYLDVPKPYRPLRLDLPLRMLGTISSPHDLPPLDVQAEQGKVQEALGGLLKEGLIALDWQVDGTLDAFRQKLRGARRAGQPYHIWHHIGHGAYGAQGSELMFCDASGRSLPVGGFQLGALFNDYPELRLALLNACEGARSDRQDALGSVAAALVECGVPAVIGMQFEISDRAAIQFAEEFYTALVSGQPVDAAVSEARLAVFCLPNWVEWATPVLYMRAADGVLFEVREKETGGEETRKKETRAAAFSSRKTDLEANIRSAYQIVRQYEGIIRDSDRPEERARARRVIQEQWALVDGYLAEYRALAGDSMPGDIDEIALSAAARQAKEDAERKAAEEAARKAKQEQERKAREELERQARAAAAAEAERKKQLLALLPELIRIPAGPFLMGSDPKKDKDAYADEQPQHTVHLPEYWICKTPVTNAHYLAFVQASGHEPPQHWENGRIPQGKENHPVVYVSWHDAVAFCRWVTEQWQALDQSAIIRLPSEAEWEKAASWETSKQGQGRKRIYPWGDEPPDAKHCNFNRNVGDTTPVGQYPAGASPYGLLDCAGNVWEWTSSQFKAYPYAAGDGREDVNDAAPRVLRGGSWLFVRAAFRYRLFPAFVYDYVGFRCVRSGSAF